jgi:hypothetical protein
MLNKVWPLLYFFGTSEKLFGLFYKHCSTLTTAHTVPMKTESFACWMLFTFTGREVVIYVHTKAENLVPTFKTAVVALLW